MLSFVYNGKDSAKRRQVQLAESLDGAKLSRNLNFVMFRLKNNDLFTKDPESGELVSANNVQLLSNVWPIDIIIGKENSSLVQNHLNELFEEFEKAATSGVEKYDWQPIQLATNVDMLAAWKANKVGGAMKRDDNPCHCCNIRNENIAVPNKDKDKCRWCTLLGYQDDPNKKCYHYPMLTDELVKSMETVLVKLEEIFQGMLDELMEVRQHSEINCKENPRIRSSRASKNDISSIHFDLKGKSDHVLADYTSKITNDLEIRGMDSSSGSLKKRQKILRQRLIQEWAYVSLKSDVKMGKERAAKAMFLLIKTVPCILHAENRMGITILTVLLVEGLSVAIKNATGSEKKAAQDFLAKVESVVNTEVFGDEKNEAQWCCPLSENKKKIGTVTMSNVRTRKVIEKIDGLLEICVPNDHRRRGKWMDCISSDYV
ncbi:hypothetical protein ACA910_008060 [Epithemia clementina (nom. ined.)]